MADFLTDIIYSNQDYSLALTRVDSSGTAEDITGWAIEVFLRIDSTSSVNLGSWNSNTGGGITLTTPLSGIFTVAIDDGDLTTLTEDTIGWIQAKYYSGGSTAGEATAYDEWHVRLRVGL